MQLIMFSIYDRAAGNYQQPWCARSQGEAIRSFQDALNNAQNTALNQHAEDYELYQLGHFDDNTGAVETPAKPHLVATGTQLKR